jgi:LAO/AO transport system kinase
LKADEPNDLHERARGLADRVLACDARSGARLMRLVDDETPLGVAAMSIVQREGPESRLVGITGSPGAGKSTLLDQLIRLHRKRDQRVGVVAVDPSSPVSGGAVLADRVRMLDHALDEGVFIRSLASRGQHGGLSASASMTARIMEAMGAGVVFLETVGIGQSEVDIACVADSVVVVVAPGMGDDVQVMKAGLYEVPDVFVVNKADREGSDFVVRDLEAMLHLAEPTVSGWVPRVVKIVATTGEGVAELARCLEEHHGHLLTHDLIEERRRARARMDLEQMLMREIKKRLLDAVGGDSELKAAAERIRLRTSDLSSELDRLISRLGGR